MILLTPKNATAIAMLAAMYWLGIAGLLGAEVGKSSAVPPVMESPSTEALAAAQRLSVASGLKVDVYASEPLIANPVSIDFDETGRCYVVETHRRRTSVFDIKYFRDWLNDDFSLRTVEDRIRFLKEVVAPGNEVIPERFRVDRNHDGVFDWKDLEVESERIRLLSDTNGDGLADRAVTYADDFKTLVSGVAAGVLAHQGNVWFACIPDLWLLRDRDGDGQAEARQSLHSGFGVHIASGGHDLHGLILGPDGKLYFSVADRGAHVEAEGKILARTPDSGAIFRCEPDGSEFEVYATGLRNPQELAFDHHGNLWTIDNNGDGGDKARLVYVVEGGDSGWHLGWQWQPDMGFWNAEKLWHLAPTNTAAYVLPPIAHVGHGPAGFAYYPGTGMPAKFKNHFFIADFPGGVRYFDVKAQGASFVAPYDELRLQNKTAPPMDGKLLWGLWPVDITFGPEGGAYVTDWIQGWEKPGKGRIYRVYDPAIIVAPEVIQTKEILAAGFKGESIKALGEYLAHPDMRVRLGAQHELVTRFEPPANLVDEVLSGINLKKSPLEELTEIAKAHPNQLARLHAMWGLGQLVPRYRSASEPLVALLDDDDPEVRAQAAKVLSERGVVSYFGNYVKVLSDPSLRVRFFGVMWLGKSVKAGFREVQSAKDSQDMRSLIRPDLVFGVLRADSTNDVYLRHACVMALAWMDDPDGLVAAGDDESSAVRMAVLLALRRMGRPEIEKFLEDSDPALVRGAARAIHDLPITEALPKLASMIEDPTVSELVMLRAINAHFMLGQPENAAYLVAFADQSSAADALRAEALDALSAWAAPPQRDRLIGLWRPVPDRDSSAASVPLIMALEPLLNDASTEVRIATLQALTRLGIQTAGETIFDMIGDDGAPTEVRIAALDSLAQLNDKSWVRGLHLARESEDPALRDASLKWQKRLSSDEAFTLYESDLNQDPELARIQNQQAALEALGYLEHDNAENLLVQWFNKLLSGQAPKELHLDILEAAQTRGSEVLTAKRQEFEKMRPADDPLAGHRDVLFGGNARLGRAIFLDRQELGCLKCHRIDQQGGDVGPDLSKVAERLSRDQILESILYPDKTVTEGYETTNLVLRDDSLVIGILKEESDTHLRIHSPDQGIVRVAKSDIVSRGRGISTMPEGLADLLARRDLRDLVEFFAGLK